MRLSLSPLSPSPVKHTQLSYAGLHHSCGELWGVSGRARSAFCDGFGPAPLTMGDWPARSAGPGPVGLMDPARHPPRQATDRPGVPGWVRSVHTRVTPGSVTTVRGVELGPVDLLWRTRPDTPPQRATDRPGVPGWARSAWRTRAPSQTDVMNLHIWW